jgi:membrane protein implicated in regulation of membrane protease activity
MARSDVFNHWTARLFCCGCFLLPAAASAYVGPGAGLSLLGALWALLIAIGTAIVFVLAWPVRRMLRRKREARERAEREREAEARQSRAGAAREGTAGSAPVTASEAAAEREDLATPRRSRRQ